MINLNKASRQISDFFGKTARRLAAATQFVQRSSKMSGPLFLKTLVFGWAKNPNASLNDLAQVADDLGVEITARGIDDRINEKAVQFMEQQFHESIKLFQHEMPIEIEILKPFKAVEILDSTSIVLSPQLKKEFTGCGANKGAGP